MPVAVSLSNTPPTATPSSVMSRFADCVIGGTVTVGRAAAVITGNRHPKLAGRPEAVAGRPSASGRLA